MLFEFLEPVNSAAFFDAEALQPSQLGLHTSFFEGKKMDLTNWDIALIGVPESRNGTKNIGSEKAADTVRKEFYKLHTPFTDKNIRVLDLGNIRVGASPRDTQFAVASAVLTLITHKVVPVIIGGSHSITYGQYVGYQDLLALVNAVVIDEKIDLSDSENPDISDDSFLSNILAHTPNYLFNLSQIGFQSYLNSPYAADMLESLNFDTVRLGMARKNITHLEPILRDADMVSIDISCLRMADAPAHAEASPNGFSGEELCQISRYAGLSDKLTSFGIYEFNPDFDVRNQTAQLLAQMMWYFVEGYYGRKGDMPQNADNFLKFTVKMDAFEHELVFWKSKVTERWWMEVPFGDKKKFERQQMVPCTHEDYEMACREEIPDRWMRVYTKLLDK